MDLNDEPETTGRRAEGFAQRLASRYAARVGFATSRGADPVARREAALEPGYVRAEDLASAPTWGDERGGGLVLARLAATRKQAHQAGDPGGGTVDERTSPAAGPTGAAEEGPDPTAVANQVYSLLRRELASRMERRGTRIPGVQAAGCRLIRTPR